MLVANKMAVYLYTTYFSFLEHKLSFTFSAIKRLGKIRCFFSGKINFVVVIVVVIHGARKSIPNITLVLL